MKSYIKVVLGFLTILLIISSLFRAPLFSHHLDRQILRVEEMSLCIRDLQLPCRWTPHLGGLYGIPLFNYLPPLPYYLGGIFFLITQDLLLSYKLLFIIPAIGSFLFMYLLGRKVWGEVGGVLSAIFYSFAPYHAVSMYVRGDLGEQFVLMLFPLFLWGMVKLYEGLKIIHVLLIAFVIAAMITSDVLLSLIFLPVILGLIATMFFKQRSWRLFRFSLYAILTGLLLSSFYWLPALYEFNLIHDPLLSWPHFAYTEHFKGIARLFFDRSWGYGESLREVPGGASDSMSYQIGWVHLFALALSTLSFFRITKVARKIRFLYSFSVLVILVSIFLIHPLATSVWRGISLLQYLQYPWRFLSLITFFSSFLIGSIFYLKKISGRGWLVLIALLLSVVVFNASYFKPEKFIQTSNQDLKGGSLRDDLIRKSNFEYLPINTGRPPNELPLQRFEILSGSSVIKNINEGSNWMSFETKTESLTRMRIAVHYFPEWRVFVDSKPVEINPQNDLGLITFALEPGNHKVDARLFNTGVRDFANILTLVGMTMYLILVLTQFSKTRRWLLYYLKAFG